MHALIFWYQGPVRKLELIQQGHVDTPLQGCFLDVVCAGEGLYARQGDIQLSQFMFRMVLPVYNISQ